MIPPGAPGAPPAARKPRASGDDPQSLYDNGNSFE